MITKFDELDKLAGEKTMMIFDELFLTPLEELEYQFILSEDNMLKSLEEDYIKSLKKVIFDKEQYYNYEGEKLK